MGLAHRIIPTILCKGRAAFKGERFNAWRSIGFAAEKVRVHAMRGVDEIVLLDIGATPEGRGPDLSLVEELTESGLFSPLAVGGGVRTVQDVKDLLRAGADKVVIGTAAVETPWLLRDIANVVGKQALVVALDVRHRVVTTRGGSHALTVVPPMNIGEIAKILQDWGAGEILLTSVEREGTMIGYDLDLIREVKAAGITVPLIANGGCSSYGDMREAIEAGASAVAAGAIFQFTEATPKGAALYLHEHGIEARV